MCSLTPGDQSLSCVFWSSLQVAEKKKEFDMCPLATLKKIFNKLLSVNIFIKWYNYKIRRRRRRQQRERQKSDRFNGKNSNSASASRFLCTFLCCHCCARLRRKYAYLEDVNKRRRNFLSHMNIDINPRNSAPGEVASIWQSKWVWIIAVKIERTRYYF